MQVMTLLNEKGGVGKTTLATHIAAGLAILGRRVVLIDADPQGQCSVLMGMAKAPGLYNLLIRDAEFEEVLCPVPVEKYSAVASHNEFWVLPGNIETRVISFVNPNPFLVRQRLADLSSWADVVVFDTSPTPSNLHTAIYVASDFILLPTHCSFLSLDGLAASIVHLANAQDERANQGLGQVKPLGIIPTMFRRDTLAHDQALKQLLAEFKQLVWPVMPLRTVWEQAAHVGQLMFRYAPDDPTTAELWALIDRVARELEVARV